MRLKLRENKIDLWMELNRQAVLTEKRIRLLNKKQYTLNIESGFTRTEKKKALGRTLLWCQGNSYE
uniref:Ribosomal protein L23 n=1 Tax=Hypericum petiolulatum TaxID=1137009 RepID=A0AAU7E4U8_9ROSI